mmetsp:Transcript_1249/g.2409  ORF Transcript_1249/g.2409 Transcript_1249/m.2409 type:complete len:94 (-) Transcript_1249:338-619(-)
METRIWGVRRHITQMLAYLRPQAVGHFTNRMPRAFQVTERKSLRTLRILKAVLVSVVLHGQSSVMLTTMVTAQSRFRKHPAGNRAANPCERAV